VKFFLRAVTLFILYVVEKFASTVGVDYSTYVGHLKRNAQNAIPTE